MDLLGTVSSSRVSYSGPAVKRVLAEIPESSERDVWRFEFKSDRD
jgi:hypothetical protein